MLRISSLALLAETIDICLFAWTQSAVIYSLFSAYHAKKLLSHVILFTGTRAVIHSCGATRLDVTMLYCYILSCILTYADVFNGVPAPARLLTDCLSAFGLPSEAHSSFPFLPQSHRLRLSAKKVLKITLSSSTVFHWTQCSTSMAAMSRLIFEVIFQSNPLSSFSTTYTSMTDWCSFTMNCFKQYPNFSLNKSAMALRRT